MKQSLPLIFFGSGPVALANLKVLADNFEVEYVVTKPKAPQQRHEPEVLEWATQADLPILTVCNKAELDQAFDGLSKKSTVGVVVDFGIIISDTVINAFDLGIINSHFSLLPLLRGADPISFAILNGLEETGVSLMQIVPALDEGPLLAQTKLSLSGDETTPSLTSSLITISQTMLVEVLPKYINGEIKVKNQDLSIKPTYTRKLTKADGVVDWTKSAIQIEREVRAYLEWPKSQATLATIPTIVTAGRVVDFKNKPGMVSLLDGRVIVGCGENSLEILKLKVAGKPEMTASAFIAGYGNRF